MAPVFVASWPFERRLASTLDRAMPKLGPEVRAQLKALVTPEAIAIMAGVLVAWVASHAIGIGEVIDVILGVVGAVAIGYSFFTGLDHLYLFATGAYGATTEPELDEAADHFAKAVGILGVQAVLAVLFRGRPYAKRETPPPPPPRTAGNRYRPTLTWDRTMPAGGGETTAWGDIVVSSRGSANTRMLALFHEQVHRWFTPKLYVLRDFRVESLYGSYINSSLWRYIEEMLAEGIANGRVFGFQEFFVGFAFPVKGGYVYLIRAGADPRYFQGLAGGGLIPELGGLLVSGLVANIAVELWYRPGAPAPRLDVSVP